MPYPDYMQDLLEMIEDPECLLILHTPPKKKVVGGGGNSDLEADADASISPSTKLISRSAPRSINIPLSANTLELMQLLDGWQEDKEITENTTSASLSSTSASILLSGLQEEGITGNGGASASTELLSQLSSRPCIKPFHNPANQIHPLQTLAVDSISPASPTEPPCPSPSPASRPTSSTNTNTMSTPAEISIMEPSNTTAYPEAMDVSPSSELKQSGLFVSPIPTILLDKMSTESEMDMDLEARLRFSSATTLATRTTEDVIADLKRLRPVQDQDPSKRRRSAVSDTDASTLSNGASSGTEEDAPAEEQEEDYDNEEEEDVVGPATKPRKITERKRRMNATVDNYVMNRTLDKIKKGTVVRPEDEANQTTRWLVNQSENRQIISTPREYQIELFERAKENNIIAVLDTGT